MKMKFKLDGPTIKDFLFKHVEKIVLGVVALLLALFVYMGTRLEGMTDMKSPDLLMELATKTKKTQIDNEGAWKDFKDLEPRKVVADVPERVGAILRPTDPAGYLVSTVWNLPDFPKQALRTDPKMYAPLHLQVTAIEGPLAIKRDPDAQQGVIATNAGPVKDPLSGDLPVGANATSGGYGETVRPPTPPPASGTRPKGKTKTPAGLSDYGPEEVPYPVYSPEAGPGAMTGQRDGAARGRTEGFLPGGADATFTAGRAVVVTAAVPWEQQFDEYQRSLAEALDYRPERDFPQYLGFYINRADVTADPSAPADQVKWDAKPLFSEIGRKDTFLWAGFPAEVIDPDWCDLQLTHPAPPFLFRDLTDALRHPEFPLLADALAEMQAAADPRRAARLGQQQPAEGLDALGLPMDPSVNNPEANRLQPGIPGGGRMKTPFQHISGPANTGMGPGMRTEGFVGPGGVGGAGATAKALEESVRKFKLLRFTDTTVQPGKIYRYRVKVVLEDPNHPKNVAQEPLTQSLDAKVKTRIAETAKTAKNRVYHVSSEWSEASAPISLPPADHFYAVAATPASTQPIIRELPPFVDKDPTAKALAVLWNVKKSVDVPGVTEVHRGSVLTFVKDAEVIHPITATPRKISDFSFATDAVVADIRGGETIKARDLKDSSSLKTPGEILVFDNQGNWHALDETYDADARMRFGPEEEATEGEAPRPRTPTRRTVPPRGPPGMGAEGAFRAGPPGSRNPPGMQAYPGMQGYPQQPARPGRTSGQRN